MAKTDTDTAAVEKPQTYTILVHSSSGPGGKDDVYLNVDGRSYLLQRDVKIPDVPKCVLNALNAAVMTEFETDKEGKLTGNTRDVPRFPYQVITD